MTTANQGISVEEIEQIVAQRLDNAFEAIAIYESLNQTKQRENKVAGNASNKRKWEGYHNGSFSQKQNKERAIFTTLASVQKNVAIENLGVTKQEIVGSQFQEQKKGEVCFGKRGKLNPRYVGPSKVMEKVRSIAYKLELPQELSRVHHTFHVSNLKKFYIDEPLAVPLDGLHIDDKLYFIEEPTKIMDREVKRLKQIRIPIVKVRWNSRRGPEFTWEREDQFRKKYPHLFTKTAPSSSVAS
ncbi:hypothetical protein Tco_1013500 [Tanacetum coccineum]